MVKKSRILGHLRTSKSVFPQIPTIFERSKKGGVLKQPKSGILTICDPSQTHPKRTLLDTLLGVSKSDLLGGPKKDPWGVDFWAILDNDRFSVIFRPKQG